MSVPVSASIAGLAVAQGREQVLGGGVVRAGARRDLHERAGGRRGDVAVLVVRRVGGDDLGVDDVVLLGRPVGDVAERRAAASSSAMSRPSTTTSSGPSRPGAERVGDQVGGLALRGVGRRGAVGREREVQVLERDREGAEADDDQQGQGDRARAHEARPADAVVEDVTVARRASAGSGGRWPPNAFDLSRPRMAGSRVSATRTAISTVAGGREAHRGEERDAARPRARRARSARSGRRRRPRSRPCRRRCRPPPRGRRCGAARVR